MIFFSNLHNGTSKILGKSPVTVCMIYAVKYDGLVLHSIFYSWFPNCNHNNHINSVIDISLLFCRIIYITWLYYILVKGIT